MYKFMLCWRYLRTRYIALATIISVTLGVATMIVFNSEMEGFSHEMQSRWHSVLSDAVFESHSLSGIQNPEWHMREIRRLVGDDVAGMTATVHVPAMLSFQVRGQWVTRQVNLIGIDEATHAEVSDFAKYLQHPKNREHLTFDLHEAGYDTTNHESGKDAKPRPQLERAGWQHRRQAAEYEKASRKRRNLTPLEDPSAVQDPFGQRAASATSNTAQAEEQSAAAGASPLDPFAQRAHGQAPEAVFDPAKKQHTGAVLGIALGSYRGQDGADHFLLLPGDDVRLTFPTAGTPPQAVSDVFTVTDFYESKMSEYDSSFLFIPLEKLQQLRGMIDPATGIGSFTSIQIKLKEGVDLDGFCDKLRGHFPPELYGIYSCKEKQGPLLAAVQMETAILNVLLFMIIAVAGFGILAIYFMIVVEKTRDIGILKSLGASSRGIMGIFLTYGLSLGMVGAGVGMLLGVLFTININEIADLLGKLTGRPVFDPSIYYFQKIPTIIDPFTVGWIVAGAMAIAVMASILPARRAARLHPVEALRYE
jgi:lipoprotein-releasing system permease protein